MKRTIIFFAILFTLSNCTKECAEWLEGSSCQNEVRERYYGVYDGNLTAYDGQVLYYHFKPAVNASTKGLSYIDGSGFYAQLFEDSTFVIPAQQMQIGLTGGSYQGFGNGHFNGDSLVYRFSYSDLSGGVSFAGTR